MCAEKGHLVTTWNLGLWLFQNDTNILSSSTSLQIKASAKMPRGPPSLGCTARSDIADWVDDAEFQVSQLHSLPIWT